MLQRIFYTGSDCLRAKSFEKPNPPAWWEDEVSAILDAAGSPIYGSAGDVWFPLQSPWGKNMQVELMSFGIDILNPAAAIKKIRGLFVPIANAV